MTDEELTRAIRECETRRGLMIRQGLKETADYQENNRLEDELLQQLFDLRFPRSDSVVRATSETRTQTGDDMKIGEMIESKYLKKEDVEDEFIVTIVGIKQANIAREDQAAEYKWLMKFKEFEKPMVLNSTNIQLCAKACGSEETNDWKGKQVVLYVDDNVSFAGKLVGGLRIKTLKHTQPVRPPRVMNDEENWGETASPASAGPDVTADEIGF